MARAAKPDSAATSARRPGEQDVVGLRIPVQHAAACGVAERRGDVVRDPERVGQREPPLALSRCVQRLALDVGHDVVQQAAGVSRVVQRHDAAGGPSSARSHLALEPLGAQRVASRASMTLTATGRRARRRARDRPSPCPRGRARARASSGSPSAPASTSRASPPTQGLGALLLARPGGAGQRRADVASRAAALVQPVRPRSRSNSWSRSRSVSRRRRTSPGRSRTTRPRCITRTRSPSATAWSSEWVTIRVVSAPRPPPPVSGG